MRPVRNVFQKLSCTEQRREGVVAYLWFYHQSSWEGLYLLFDSFSFIVRQRGEQVFCYKIIKNPAEYLTLHKKHGVRSRTFKCMYEFLQTTSLQLLCSANDKLYSIPQRQFAVKCYKTQQLPELFLPCTESQRNCYTVVMEELLYMVLVIILYSMSFLIYYFRDWSIPHTYVEQRLCT